MAYGFDIVMDSTIWNSREFMLSHSKDLNIEVFIEENRASSGLILHVKREFMYSHAVKREFVHSYAVKHDLNIEQCSL